MDHALQIFNFFKFFFKIPESECGTSTDSTTTAMMVTTSTTALATTASAATRTALGICNSMMRTEYRTSAYTNPTTLELVELFHYGQYYQWFKVERCDSSYTASDSPIGCAQRYYPQEALTIRRYGSKYLVQLETVYVESGCEVDIFSN